MWAIQQDIEIKNMNTRSHELCHHGRLLILRLTGCPLKLWNPTNTSLDPDQDFFRTSLSMCRFWILAFYESLSRHFLEQIPGTSTRYIVKDIKWYRIACHQIIYCLFESVFIWPLPVHTELTAVQLRAYACESAFLCTVPWYPVA